jgi:Flp pilus assembly protein TadG
MKHLKSEHYILLILAVITLAASAVAYAFMYKQSIQRAEAAASARASIEYIQEQSILTENLEKTYADSAVLRATLPTYLVSEEDAVPFINAVEAVGPASGAKLSLSSLSSGTDPASSSPVVSLSVSLRGTWQTVMSGVELLENLPYAESVQDLRLSSDGTGTATSTAPVWTADLQLSVLSTS